MAKGKLKENLSPAEVRQRLQKGKAETHRQQFLQSQEEFVDPNEWIYEPHLKKWYKDDGETYENKSQSRLCPLAEIHFGAVSGINVFPHKPHILYLRGQLIGSDESVEALKAMADDMLKETING